MSFTEKFLLVLRQAQDTNHCHKKLLKTIENEYKKIDMEVFIKMFTGGLYKFYYSDSADQNLYVARGLEFLAKLAMRITLLNVPPTEVPNLDGTGSNVHDISTDPFFNNLLESSLKYASVVKTETRLNTCFFITLLLQNIGNNVDMDHVQCNKILDALIERLNDAKYKLRLHAIKALTRLQEPSNPDCVVMNSFLKLFIDTNPEVRKEVVKVIARHPQSFAKIRERFTDVDLKVRHAAYERCADINPRANLKIVDRNFVLTSAFDDNDKKVQQILKTKLMPKWLNFYEGNHLNFLKALKLDGDENDFIKFEKLCEKVVNMFLRINPLTEIVSGLPIDKNEKLIPIKQLNLENVMYWSNIIQFLRKRDDAEDYLEGILPELTPFSDYIERVLKEKFIASMDEWENLNNQNIVLYLFHIASGFDFSDEVGRKKFYALIIQILTTYRFQPKITERIVSVAALLNTNIDSFTTDMCHIISEIREPLADDVLSEAELRKKNFEMAKVNVRLRELEITEEEALKKKDFDLAKITCNEIAECQRLLESFKSNEKVKVSKDDPEILCRCLDILISVLKLRNITYSPALRICVEEFLMPLSRNNISEVHWRFILCLGLLSILDKETALQHANFICLPIATYTTVLNYDKAALKTSLACITDLIRLYGLSVLGIDEDTASVSSQEQKNSRRKLYTENMDQQVARTAQLNIEFIIDIILDMLDDEDECVRYTAASSLSKLMVHSFFPVDPELISKLILKWFNPLTEKKDTKLQQQIGIIIKCFSNNVKGAKKIIGNAILVIITTLQKAPAGSPLQAIDMDNVLKFLGALTSIENDENTENVHNNLADTVIEKIAKNPTDASVPHLTKLLTHLDVVFDEPAAQKNMVSSVEFLLTDVLAEERKNLLKFIKNLQKNQTFKDQSTTLNSTQTTMKSTSNSINNSEVTNSSRVQEEDTKSEAQKRRLQPVGSENSKKEKINDISKRGNLSNKSESPDLNDISRQNGRKQLSLANTAKKIPFVSVEQLKLSEKIREKSEKCTGNVVEESSKNVFMKYDYTHLKLETPNKNLENEQRNKKNNNGTKNIRVISQVVLEKSKDPENRRSESLRTEEGRTPVVFLTPVKENGAKSPSGNFKKRPAFTPLSAGNERTFKKYPRSTPRTRSETTRKDSVSTRRLRKNEESKRTLPRKRQPESPCTATKKITKKAKKHDERGDETETSSTRSGRSGKKDESVVRTSNRESRRILKKADERELDSETRKGRKEKENVSECLSQERRSLRRAVGREAANVTRKNRKQKENISQSPNRERRSSLRSSEATGGANRTEKDENGTENKSGSSNKESRSSLRGRRVANGSEKGETKDANMSQSSRQRRVSSRRKVACSPWKPPSQRSRTRSGKFRKREENPAASSKHRGGALLRKDVQSPLKPAQQGSRTRFGKSGKKEENVAGSVKQDRRASLRKTTYSPVKAARILRRKNLRKSLHSRRKILEETESDDELEIDSNDRPSRRKNKGDDTKEDDSSESSGDSEDRLDTSRRFQRIVTKNGAMDSGKRELRQKKHMEDVEVEKKVNNKHVQNKISNSLKKSDKNRIETKTGLTRGNTKANELVKIHKGNEAKSTRANDKNYTPPSIQGTKKKIRNGSTENLQNQSKEPETANKTNKTSLQLLRNNGVLRTLNNSSNKNIHSPITGTRSKTQKILDGLMTTRSGIKLNANITLETNTSTTSTSRTKRDTSRGASRKQLDFSSFSDETVLKTFLQGDEEFASLEELVIEDVSSVSSNSNDSKKENILNVSSTSSSSQEIRKSGRRKIKTTFHNGYDTSPRRKVLRIDDSIAKDKF